MGAPVHPVAWAPLASAATSYGLDEQLFRALNLAGQNAVLDLVMVFFTSLALPYILALLVIPLWWKGHRDLAFDLLVVLVVVMVVTEAVKFLVGRPRPCDVLSGATTISWDTCASETDPSFPSGHTSRIFAVVALLAFCYRWPVRVGGFAVAIVSGLSRVYLGVHWPSDVLGGALLGIGVAAAFFLLEKRMAWYRNLRAKIVGAVARVIPSPGERDHA